MKLKIFLFVLFIIKKINLMMDYCTTRLNPKEPNDCVFFGYNNKKCCFNPNNQSQCFFESSNQELLCEEDYFYNFMKGGDKYEEYKDKNGYCVFIYGDIKGAFEYDEKINKILEISEVKNLEIECLSNQNIIKKKYHLFIFTLLLILS